MAQASLLARSGLWRVTRHESVRRLYERLAAADIFVAQLDQFERPTAHLPRPTDVTLAATKIDVLPAVEHCPAALGDAPLAPSDRIVLARRAGETVGWCCLSDRPVYVPELHRRLSFPGSYLWRLYVRPADRGRGIGTALARRAIDHSRTVLDVDTITALVAPDNLPSRKAFDALDFEPTERYTSGGCLGREWHRHTAIG